jgi:isochorismate pyruvate lyase
MKTPRACRNLEDIRTAVNAIDREIVRLLGQRKKYAMAALQFKADLKSIGDPQHRRKLFAQRRQWAVRRDVSEKMVDKIYRAIVAESKRMHLEGFRARRR